LNPGRAHAAQQARVQGLHGWFQKTVAAASGDGIADLLQLALLLGCYRLSACRYCCFASCYLSEQVFCSAVSPELHRWVPVPAQLMPARCSWLLQVSGGADLFVGFGGVVQRPAVAAEADWYIYDYQQLLQSLKRYTVRAHLQSRLLHAQPVID